MQSDRDWQPFEPMIPRRLIDGTLSGWLQSETVMRRRENGAWVYRRMTPDEAIEVSQEKRDFQTW
jgi:hypothetical protein